MKNEKKHNFLNSHDGSAFTVLLAGVVVAALISFTAYRIISGPIETMVNSSNFRVTEFQFLSNGRLLVLDALDKGIAGDCDNDGYIEPLPFTPVTPTTLAPENGGQLDSSQLSTNDKDVWGTPIGYCVWDIGTTSSCVLPPGTGMLNGTPDPNTGSPKSQTVIALISAGPNKIFETQCNNYVDGTTDVITDMAAAAQNDDIVRRYSFAEAMALSGNIWTVSAADLGTLETDFDINVTDGGIGQFSSSVDLSGRLTAGGGVQLGTETDVPDSDCSAPADEGLMRFNTGSGAVEICDGASFNGIGGAGSFDTIHSVRVEDFESERACPATAATGEIRYNGRTHELELCDGTSWRRIRGSEQNYATFYATDNSLTLNAPGFPRDTTVPNAENAFIRFVNGPSFDVDSVTLTNTENFIINWDGCSGITLGLNDGENDACSVEILGRTQGVNGTFDGQIILKSAGGQVLTVDLTMSSSGFCEADGAIEDGGHVVGCTEDYKYIMQEFGCGSITTNPTCDGTVASISSFQASDANNNYNGTISFTDGATNTTNILGGSDNYPAAQYCADLVHNSESDWYLPSISEWMIARNNAHNFAPSFAGDSYWTSSTSNTEFGVNNTDGATVKPFLTGTFFADEHDKTDSYKVLCMRKEARSGNY